MAFPTYSDPVDVAQLQAAVEAAIAAHTKSGTENGTIAIGDAYVDFPVVFSTPFPKTPAIALGPRGSARGYIASVTVKTASGFTVRVFRPSGASTGTAVSVWVDWVATDLAG